MTLLQQIPPLITVSCTVIFAMFVFFVFRMAREARRVRGDVAAFLDVLGHLPERTLEMRHEGLQFSDVERAQSAAKGRGANVQRLWNDLELSLEPYRGADGVQSWFTIRPVAELLPRNAVIDRVYQTSLHQAVPSVLTALGLLTTFLAILLALEGVTVQVRSGAEIVEGIGGLINGLAGKFLSSIVALFLAVTFTLLEKRIERKLEDHHDTLLEKASAVLPGLSAARLLLDMQALSSRRTELLEGFYGEIADRLVSLIRTEIVEPQQPTRGAETSYQETDA